MYDKPSTAFLESFTAGDFDSDSLACLANLLAQSSDILADETARPAIHQQTLQLLEPKYLISKNLQPVGSRMDMTADTFEANWEQFAFSETNIDLIEKLELNKSDEFLEVGTGMRQKKNKQTNKHNLFCSAV